MSTSITPPKNVVPVGRVTIGNTTYDVAQHPEFVRFFFDLFRRVGGNAALTNTELDALVGELDSASLNARSDTTAQDAMRAVDELRNELSSMRSDRDTLRVRIEQLEDRFAA